MPLFYSRSTKVKFNLWDYLHDLRLDGLSDIELETIPDYINRIQNYEIACEIDEALNQ